jgi:phosphoribosylformylglycinamidine synthase
MEFVVQIRVTLRPSILDPQGKATHHALEQLGFTGIRGVRMGKFIALRVEAGSGAEAREVATAACGKLLANPVMEDFEIEGAVPAPA